MIVCAHVFVLKEDINGDAQGEVHLVKRLPNFHSAAVQVGTVLESIHIDPEGVRWGLDVDLVEYDVDTMTIHLYCEELLIPHDSKDSVADQVEAFVKDNWVVFDTLQYPIVCPTSFYEADLFEVNVFLYHENNNSFSDRGEKWEDFSKTITLPFHPFKGLRLCNLIPDTKFIFQVENIVIDTLRHVAILEMHPIILTDLSPFTLKELSKKLESGGWKPNPYVRKEDFAQDLIYNEGKVMDNDYD